MKKVYIRCMIAICMATTLGAVPTNSTSTSLQVRSPTPPTIVKPRVSNAQFEALGFIALEEPIDLVDVTMQTLLGDLTMLSDYTGKVVALNLWATWCPPCKEEMPSMERVHTQLNPNKFTILAVATPMPPRETEQGIRQFVETNNYTFPILLDTDFQVSSVYNTGSIPTTWIIDKQGKVRALRLGMFSWDAPEIIALFEALMEE